MIDLKNSVLAFQTTLRMVGITEITQMSNSELTKALRSQMKPIINNPFTTLYRTALPFGWAIYLEVENKFHHLYGWPSFKFYLSNRYSGRTFVAFFYENYKLPWRFSTYLL